ncbi:CBN-RSA-2 protein [Caenorhabditis brenneri]|uniref:CBN-RSA-2 protein n=1 Tax=Caenorhabditis brenneri TaxID=135651 RepID=G0ML89_CAEBE|nr:CBN-RSA-2 protein [Caenorhabditis brenneri]
MSKIPVPSGGFRSWLSANEGKPSKSVLYEQKYQIHHDRVRNKENMSDNEEKSSTFVSMVNPRPTAEDYEKYDADRRLREKARDMRVAQRSASSSARNSFSMTPEPKEASPTNDQYFTPQHRSSSGLEEEFVTPTTSKKEQRKERRTSDSSDLTPLSTKPLRHKSSDQQAYYTTCLSRKMEENFSRMQDLVFSGFSIQEARDKTITEMTIRENGGRSPRRSSRRIDENIETNRSSSQPPPIETLNMLPRLSKPESPMPTSFTAKETPILRTSYVDTLVATHQMQIQYADRIAIGVEKQMTKLESLKNLAALSKSPSAEARKRRESEALRMLVETNEQKTKKLEVIKELKERIEKITNVQLSIHQLVSSQPFEGDSYNERLLKSLDGWASLPFHEFDIQTAREMQVLHRKMMDSIHKFKNVAAMHRKQGKLNRSLNRSLNGRKSIAMKILPSGASICDSSSDSVKTASKSRAEAATQVTARLAETIWTQTSPRTVGVERLDLSSLEKANTSSQTTPTVKDVIEKSSTSLSVPTTSALSMTEPVSTVADIDDMLNGIVLHNRSLETVEPLPQFKSDISYPTITTPSSEHSTPRSARVSLDSESARRLSAGVSNFLEQIKKENESFGNKEDIEVAPESSLPATETPVHIDAPVIEEEPAEINSTPDNQSPTSNEESELELNVEDHDATQFEHEMEEQEEQRRLREAAMTPTPPIEREQEIASEDYRRMTTLMDQEDEEDETKKFVNNEYFEGSIEDEPSGVQLNDSADDSGFLLSNTPMPRLKSIFDNVNNSPPSSVLRADTPRSPQEEDSTYVGMDMEEYCRNDFLQEIGPIMVKKAIEFQNELRGLDWLSAQSVWKPPALEEMNVDHYDVYDMFDSFSILIWGAVVELINIKYLKFGRKMTVNEEYSFEKETLEMLHDEYGPESKKKEWCREVKMSKKLSGMNPCELDYRYDVRRGLPDIEKQKYQRQQIQMVVIADRYPRSKLISEINEVYNTEKELLGHVILESELNNYGGLEDNNEEKLVAVSDV